VELVSIVCRVFQKLVDAPSFDRVAEGPVDSGIAPADLSR